MATAPFVDYSSPGLQMTTAERTSVDWGLGAGIIPDKVMVLDTDRYSYYLGDGATSGGRFMGGFKRETDAHMYMYDGLRSKWLSVHSNEVTFGHNNLSATNWFRTAGGLTMSASCGYYVQRPGRIVQMSWTADTYTTPTIEVLKNSTSIFTQAPTANGQILTLDYAVTTGDILNVKLIAGSILNMAGIVYVKWEK